MPHIEVEIGSDKPVPLTDLVKLLRNETFLLPAFQRPKKWNFKHKRLLIESIYSEMVIGALTLWQLPDGMTVQARSFMDDSTKEATQHHYLVLDGQQRLRTILEFMTDNTERDGRSHRVIYADSNSKSLKSGIRQTTPNKYRAWSQSKKNDQWLLCDLLERNGRELKAYCNGDTDDWFYKLNRSFSTYNMTTLVANGIDERTAIELFDRINTAGTKLSKKDVILAHLKAQMPDLHSKINTLCKKLSKSPTSTSTSPFSRLFNEKLVQTILIYRVFGTVSDRLVLDRIVSSDHGLSQSSIKKAFTDTKRALKETRAWLTGIGIRDTRGISGDALAVAASFFLIKGRTQVMKAKLTTWFIWANLIKPHTGGGTQINVTEDMDHISAKSVNWKELKGRLIDSIKSNDGRFNRLKFSPEVLGAVKPKNISPKMNSFARRLPDILLAKLQARDWIETSSKIMDADDAELHHIFPKKMFAGGLKGNHRGYLQHPANHTWIRKSTNASIGGGRDANYLKDRTKRDKDGHSLPGMRSYRKEDFKKFLEKRTKTIVVLLNQHFSLNKL